MQANVDVRDIRQLDAALQTNLCYRIEGFGSTRTDTWQRTLENDTTLLFGRYTRAVQLEDEEFPEHFFNFIAYNELGRRADVKNSILTGICYYTYKQFTLVRLLLTTAGTCRLYRHNP